MQAVEVLTNWLVTKGVSLDNLRRHAQTWGAEAVVGYVSAMDGFGSSASDLDLYLMGAATGLEVQKSPLPLHPSRWSWNEVEGLADRLAGQSPPLNLNQLRVLHRLQVGVPLQESERFEKLRQQLSEGRLRDALAEYYLRYFDSHLADAQEFVKLGDGMAGLLQAREALVASMGYFATCQGACPFNDKWVWAAFSRTAPGTLPMEARALLLRPNLTAVDDLLVFSQHIIGTAGCL